MASNIPIDELLYKTIQGTDVPLTSELPLGSDKSTWKSVTTEQVTTEQIIEKLKALPATDVTNVITKETIVLPTIVKETITPVFIHEIQPEVTRIIEKTEIQHIVQPTNVTVTTDAKVVDTVYTPIVKATEIKEKSMSEIAVNQKIAQTEISTQQIQAQKDIYIEKAPIVHEVVKTHIVEEVQPEVIQKTIQPTVVKETVPIQEKIVEAVHTNVVVKETIENVVVKETVEDLRK